MAGERRVFVALNVPESERGALRGFVMAAAVLGVRLAPVNDCIEYRRVGSDGKPVRSVSWFLEQSDPKRVYRTAELYRWWRDPAWLAANPTHPLALLREYWQALQDAEAREKSALILAAITRGNRHLHLPLNTNLDPERKAKLLELLEK
jgi:hypothetical protein